MRRSIFASVFALTGAALITQATADVEEHQVEYLWDVSRGNEALDLEFPQFDTRNGTRVLTGVTLILDGQYDLTMWAENLEDFPIAADEWFVECGLFMLFDFDDLPLGGIAGAGLGLYSTDLAANDGVDREGPDYTEWNYADPMASSVEIRPEDFGIFRGEGVLGAQMYPFLSILIPAPPPRFSTDAKSHVHSGIYTLRYDWQPASAATLSTDPAPLIAGQRATVTASNLLPNMRTYLAASTSGRGSQWVPFLGVTLDLRNPRQVSSIVMSDSEGDASWSGPVPGGLSGRTLWLQAAQDGLKTEVLEAPVQ